MNKVLRVLLLASASTAVALPAFAADKADKAAAASQSAATDARIGLLEQQLRDVRTELADIKQTQADSDHSAALIDLKRSTSDQYVDLNNRFESQARVAVDDGRLSVASPDGRFTFALRGLIQYDVGYVGQGKNPSTVDLNSGSNFRRAQIATVGTLYTDWSYNFTYDFGGNGTEKNGYIYTAYIEYDGFKPFGLRIGAYAPPAGLEDSTGSADLIFLERPASADIARNIAGSPSRDAITAFYAGDRFFGAVSYTGGKATDAATFDEQQAVVARLSYLVVNDTDFHWLVDVDGTDVFKLPDAVPNNTSPTTDTLFGFSNGPELGFDASKTVNTGTFDASGVKEWGVETAANWKYLYAQAGYFGYEIERRTGTLSNPNFSGWYALASWSLTGESKRYDPSSASFRGLRPSAPLGSANGFGALELVGRFSSINLNDNPFLSAAAGGVAGGQQNVWTAGVNWYPNNIVRFSLDYDDIHVSHSNAPTGDISADALVLRAQVAI